ncbi:hypothetical protein FTO70_06655 [Methanosarcina sp. KYL-1]|uniref:hypothetical protein n=1 Tax=Methanosarcina sp. KYL-1 TaxID=2602068 RepID=UPI002100F73C|nr:hypothetical protein [Methanosarcina sp. KYL-1]MCQ1535373.1 hypothetical protein [Methanosarcina sp. KYL-1]
MEKVLSVLPVLLVPALLTDSVSVVSVKGSGTDLKEAREGPEGSGTLGFSYKALIFDGRDVYRDRDIKAGEVMGNSNSWHGKQLPICRNNCSEGTCCRGTGVVRNGLFLPEANYTITESIMMKRVGNDFKEWGIHKEGGADLAGWGDSKNG